MTLFLLPIEKMRCKREVFRGLHSTQLVSICLLLLGYKNIQITTLGDTPHANVDDDEVGVFIQRPCCVILQIPHSSSSSTLELISIIHRPCGDRYYCLQWREFTAIISLLYRHMMRERSKDSQRGSSWIGGGVRKQFAKGRWTCLTVVTIPVMKIRWPFFDSSRWRCCGSNNQLGCCWLLSLLHLVSNMSGNLVNQLVMIRSEWGIAWNCSKRIIPWRWSSRLYFLNRLINSIVNYDRNRPRCIVWMKGIIRW